MDEMSRIKFDDSEKIVHIDEKDSFNIFYREKALEELLYELEKELPMGCKVYCDKTYENYDFSYSVFVQYDEEDDNISFILTDSPLNKTIANLRLFTDGIEYYKFAKDFVVQ